MEFRFSKSISVDDFVALRASPATRPGFYAKNLPSLVVSVRSCPIADFFLKLSQRQTEIGETILDCNNAAFSDMHIERVKCVHHLFHRLEHFCLLEEVCCYLRFWTVIAPRRSSQRARNQY